MEKEGNKGGTITATVLAAAGTIAVAVTGTSFAAPLAIGAGVCLLVYGVVKLVKDNKK